MPHSVPLSDADSSGPLVGSLTALSLTEAPETETVDAEPSRYNPFIPYLVNEVGTPNAVHSINQLIRDVIPRHLAELRQTRRFELAESDSLYLRGRQFQERWGASEASFLNRKELLSGWIDFPAVMLLNPSPCDHLPYGEMVDQSTTLTWVEEGLQPAKLTLSDVIIFNMFPMVRVDILKWVEEADRLVLVQESFALTVEGLRRIRPRVLISCQCSTHPQNTRWGFFEETMAQQLCSSVAWAQSGLVRGVDTAVIKESLRMSPGVASPLPRVVPSSGAHIDKTFIPGGTVVGMSSHFVHRDETIFSSPDEFIPERWLNNKGRELDKWLVAFSKNPQHCLGLK
ncbi:hypothetical protein BBP40_000220 [Aspergillus hancockii]|nr:hypothetical protein BBP40_000220 [Aspergillus hancockii]